MRSRDAALGHIEELSYHASLPHASTAPRADSGEGEGSSGGGSGTLVPASPQRRAGAEEVVSVVRVKPWPSSSSVNLRQYIAQHTDPHHGRFCDPDFPPCEASLYVDPEAWGEHPTTGNDICWR